MRRVLVLRPEPGASATVERARKLGLEAVATPLFEIEPLAWAAPDPADFDALLLTSANAIRFGGDQLPALRDLPVRAVGTATAQTAREAGFTVETIGQAGVDDMLQAIEPGVRLLHLCGAHHIELAGPNITQVPVYRSKEKAAPNLVAAEGCVALIHSPRAGRRFAELVDAAGEDRSAIAIAGISGAAAAAVGDGWQVVDAVERPNDDALLALAARLCNNSAAT